MIIIVVLSVDCLGRSGRLTVLWNNSYFISIVGYFFHFIDMTILSSDMGPWHLTGFYGCLERHKRKESWGTLTQLAQRFSLPWVCIGDFNDMLNMDDKASSSIHPDYLLNGFQETIEECQLQDL